MSTKQRLIYVVGAPSQTEHANWMQGTLTDSMQDADLVVFTGGADVEPARYGEPAHRTTYPSPARDAREWPEMDRAVALGKPIAAICRGSQLSCAYAGGKLVQDMRHPYLHEVETFDGHRITVTSDHHQCQHPWGMASDRFKVLAWANGLSPYHRGGHDEEMVNGIVDGNREAEIVLYPHIRCLATQSHPEYVYGDPEHQEYITYMRSLLDRHMDGRL